MNGLIYDLFETKFSVVRTICCVMIVRDYSKKQVNIALFKTFIQG